MVNVINFDNLKGRALRRTFLKNSEHEKFDKIHNIQELFCYQLNNFNGDPGDIQILDFCVSKLGAHIDCLKVSESKKKELYQYLKKNICLPTKCKFTLPTDYQQEENESDIEISYELNIILENEINNFFLPTQHRYKIEPTDYED